MVRNRASWLDGINPGRAPPAHSLHQINERSSWPRHFDAERGREVDLVLLLLTQDLPQVLCDRKLVARLSLMQAYAVLLDGLGLVVEVRAQHLLLVLRRRHRLWRHGRL